MLSSSARAVLFLSSYAPLLLVFALLDSFGAGWPTAACLAASIGSVIGLMMILRTAGRLDTTSFRVQAARRRDQDVMAYVVTYLLPFVGLGTDTGREQLALLLFVLVVGVVYVRSHLFYVNPLLNIFGYRLFEATVESGHPITLLTHRDYVRRGEEIEARRLSNYVYWERR